MLLSTPPIHPHTLAFRLASWTIAHEKYLQRMKADKEDLKKAIHRGYTRGQIDCSRGTKAIQEINVDGTIFYQDTIHYDMPIVSKSSIYIED